MRANFRCLLAAVIILTSLVVPISPATAHQAQKETTPVSETSRTARKAESVEVVESEISGAVVRIDTSSGAVLDNQLVSRDGEVTIEAITILRGTSFIDIFFIGVTN